MDYNSFFCIHFIFFFFFYLYTKTTVRLKGLDTPAPALQTLADWSLQNIVAVGLGSGLRSSVYLSSVSKVTKLCDLGSDDLITVAWTQQYVFHNLFVFNPNVQLLFIYILNLTSKNLSSFTTFSWALCSSLHFLMNSTVVVM